MKAHINNFKIQNLGCQLDRQSLDSKCIENKYNFFKTIQPHTTQTTYVSKYVVIIYRHTDTSLPKYLNRNALYYSRYAKEANKTQF